MKRWIRNLGKYGQFSENKQVDDFLEEILAVCDKHQMIIGHEDQGGSFVVEKLTQMNSKSIKSWLLEAHDNTGTKKE